MFARVSGQRRVASTSDKVFPAPVRGWVQSGNITTASPDQAEVLDNFICTAQGARLRGGAAEYADLGASVVRMFTHSGASNDLFASTASKVFDVDRVAGGGSNAFADVEGLSGGDWSSVQISTAGGGFTVAVNGTDPMLYWNGSAFEVVNGVATNNVGFDAETGAFAVGETITGGTSGATAVVAAILKTSATAGTLKINAITGGPFTDDEALSGSVAGAATANGASAAVSPVVSLTGVSTTDLSQVWLFKERLFFVEKDTQSAWYLPVQSIGGTASEINLGSVFRLGGNLLFGATWSIDSGNGLDDVCIFVSTNGEVAVFEGTDPASASTWALVGVYAVGKPLNKHAHFRAGGDLAILTDEGIVPVSEALKKDRGALQGVAITFPIEDAWRAVVANSVTAYPVSATLWQSKTILLVGTGGEEGGLPISFIANARTGAWSRVVGWDVRCSAVSNNSLYFGNSAGKVLQADTGGTDDGEPFTGLYVPKFSQCGTPNFKSAVHAGITYRAPEIAKVRLGAFADYQVGTISAPDTSVVTTGAVWGVGVWGVFVWGGNSPLKTFQVWQSVAAGGNSLAPALSVHSGLPALLKFEILSTHLRYERGNVF
jgi:hypothetical protein